MGQVPDFSDDLDPKICIHCGKDLVHKEVSRDHVPSKVLLDRPYPKNLAVVPICRECNVGFSRDEEYLAAILASVISGSTDPRHLKFPGAARVLEYSPRLRGRIDEARRSQITLWGNPEVQWATEFERISRVLVKNARGHILYELGWPMADPPSYVNVWPIQLMSVEQRERFEYSPDVPIWPDEDSRMMQRILVQDWGPGGWIDIQSGIYRYAISEPLCVHIVLHEYLASIVAWNETADIQASFWDENAGG